MSNPPISSKPGQRKALMAGYGSKEAIESCRKMFELLGRNARSFNFDVVPMIGNDKDEKLNPDRLMRSLRYLIEQHKKQSDGEDTLLVYLCLRNHPQNLVMGMLRRLMDIQYNRDFTSRELIYSADGGKEAALKNIAFIFDLDHPLDFTQDPFHHITEGTSLLALNGASDRTSRNGKYTFFSGLLVEALKGGASNIYGLVTLLNLHRFMLESMEFEPGVTVQTKVLASESVFLRRTRGVMRRRQMKVFCEAFQSVPNEDSALSYSPFIIQEQVDANPELKELINMLLDLHLIDKYKIEDEDLWHRVTGLLMGDSKQGYMLSAQGKHLQDMWNNDYFKYL